jgi:Cu/Zn superoxide dismutase
MWHAEATLTPVKGAKLKASAVRLVQTEGSDASIEADALEGAKPGTYWLVVHDGTSCDANAAKAGAAWAAAAESSLKLVVAKDGATPLDATTVSFAISGDEGAVGHAMVLHEDKKGKPGKALACGVIAETEG